MQSLLANDTARYAHHILSSHESWLHERVEDRRSGPARWLFIAETVVVDIQSPYHPAPSSTLQLRQRPRRALHGLHADFRNRHVVRVGAHPGRDRLQIAACYTDILAPRLQLVAVD